MKFLPQSLSVLWGHTVNILWMLYLDIQSKMLMGTLQLKAQDIDRVSSTADHLDKWLDPSTSQGKCCNHSRLFQWVPLCKALVGRQFSMWAHTSCYEQQEGKTWVHMLRHEASLGTTAVLVRECADEHGDFLWVCQYDLACELPWALKQGSFA